MSGSLIAERQPNTRYKRVMSRWGRSRKYSLHTRMVNTTRVSALILLLTCSYKGDHIFGLLALLASRLNGAGGTVDGVDDPRAHESKDQKVS
jgi:hypothetical protein